MPVRTVGPRRRVHRSCTKPVISHFRCLLGPLVDETENPSSSGSLLGLLTPLPGGAHLHGCLFRSCNSIFFSFRLMRLAHHPASLRMRALRPLWESSFATADAAAVTPPATLGDLAGVRVCELQHGCSTGYYRYSCLRAKSYGPFWNS